MLDEIASTIFVGFQFAGFFLKPGQHCSGSGLLQSSEKRVSEGKHLSLPLLPQPLQSRVGDQELR